MAEVLPLQRLDCLICTMPLTPQKGSFQTCTNCFPGLKNLLKSNQSKHLPTEDSHSTDVSIKSESVEPDDLGIAQNHSCPFSKQGCKASLTLEEIEIHRLDCQFACLNFCSLLDIEQCTQEIETNELIYHLKSKHEVAGLTLDTTNSSLTVHQSGDLSSSYDAVCWNPVYIIYNGLQFYVRTKHINKTVISWNVAVLGSEKTASKYSATITITSPRDPSLQLEMKMQVVSLSNTTSGFSIPISKLKELSSVNNHTGESDWKLHIRVVTKPTASTSGYNVPSYAMVKSPACSWKRSEDDDRHWGFECDGCQVCPIPGVRWRCMSCFNFDFCPKCMDENTYNHDPRHTFLRLPKSTAINYFFPILYRTGYVNFDVEPEVESSESEDESETENY